VLTATGFVNEKKTIFDPHRIDTHPSTDHQNFITGDYVGDPYGCTKLDAHMSMGGFWAHG